MMPRYVCARHRVGRGQRQIAVFGELHIPNLLRSDKIRIERMANGVYDLLAAMFAAYDVRAGVLKIGFER